MEKILMFSYGSIILPEMTKNTFDYVFTPLKSVFIKGYKLEVKHANSVKYPNYHFIICNSTYNENDIIPGFLIEVPINLLNKLDKWEGIQYKRQKIQCFDRNLEKIECEIYLKNYEII